MDLTSQRPWPKKNDVMVVDNISTGKLENLANIDVQFIQAALRIVTFFENILHEATCVFRQAAIASFKKSYRRSIAD